MILIIDNQSEKIKSLEDLLIDRRIPFRSVAHDSELDHEMIARARGLVLSGGPGNPYGPLNLSADYTALLHLQVPTLGICLGHEIIAAAYLGSVEMMAEPQEGTKEIILIRDDPIFEGLPDTIELNEQHRYEVTEIPQEFVRLAYSEQCRVEAIRHRTMPIYGFQSHPETMTPHGAVIIDNFLRMCGYGTVTLYRAQSSLPSMESLSPS